MKVYPRGLRQQKEVDQFVPAAPGNLSHFFDRRELARPEPAARDIGELASFIGDHDDLTGSNTDIVLFRKRA